MYQNPYKVYQQTQVTTASPEKILLMLYEGAIRFIKTAQVRLQEKKLAEKGQAISKALAIVSELMNTLDHSKGGALAADLENLYMFVMDKLIEGNIHNKLEDIQAAENVLTILYSGWEDVINNPRGDGVPSAKLQPGLYQQYETVQKSPQSDASASSRPLSVAAPAAVPQAQPSSLRSTAAPLAVAPAGNPAQTPQAPAVAPTPAGAPRPQVPPRVAVPPRKGA